MFQFLQWGASQFFRVEPAKIEKKDKDSEAGERHMADTESKMQFSESGKKLAKQVYPAQAPLLQGVRGSEMDGRRGQTSDKWRRGRTSHMWTWSKQGGWEAG